MLYLALAHVTGAAHAHTEDLTAIAGIGGLLLVALLLSKLVRKVDRWTTPH